LSNWLVFIQKLSNIFGLYTPKDNNESAIVAILSSPDGKTVSYFIQFAKYQNCIYWDDCSLRKVMKDAIPSYISEELHYTKEDLFTFKGFK